MKKINWWAFIDICIAGERNAVKGFAKRRKELEKLIEPYLSKKKTEDAIRFRGKTRYVSLLDSGKRVEMKVWSAIWGLQCIYRAEIAIKNRDVESAVRWAYGVGRSHSELQFASKLGVSLDEAMAAAQRTRRNSQAKGRATRKDISRERLQELLDKHRDERDWRKQIRRDLRAEGVEVSGRTISNRLKEFGLQSGKQALNCKT